MDYNDNDYQSHLTGEDSSKVSSVLHPYALPKFDFDDSLQGHLRFDSLVENEVFLGIPTQEDNQWIEDFSRGSSGIEFSSSAADSCSIPRRNNVWSEATSTESVEMLLKSVGQEEMVPGDTIIEESDAGNELGCLIQPVESNLKLDDKRDDIKESSSAAPADESVEFTVTFSKCERTEREGKHIACAAEMQALERIADRCSDIAGERCSGVTAEEKSQTEIKSIDENLGEAKTSQDEFLPDKSDRHPSVPVIQSAINECLTDARPVSVEILDSQHNLTSCHSGNTSGLPSEHHKPEEKQISVSKEKSSTGDEKLCGSGVESETCTSNASPLSLSASELEVVKELPTDTRMIKLQESCVQRNECSFTADGCKEDASSAEPPEICGLVTVSSKVSEDKLQAEGNSILCEDEEASISQCLDSRDSEDQENGSKGQMEVSAVQISDGLSTCNEKEENILESHIPLNLGMSEACTISELSEPSKPNNGNGNCTYSLEGPSNIQEASISAELIVERPVPENLETGNDADRVSKGDACAGDRASSSVPVGSMDICGESFPCVVDVDTTNEDVSSGKEKEEVLPVENETERSCERDHGVRSSSVGEEPGKISDHSALIKQASNAGFEGGSLISGGTPVSVPLPSGSGAIATEIVNHDEKLKPVSVLMGSEHLAEKEKMEVVPSVEAQVATLKESIAGRPGPLSADEKDASGDCHMDIAPVIVNQNSSIQGNPDTASDVEQAAIAEANSECFRHVEACAMNSGSTIKEGDGAEAAALARNQEIIVETVELGKVGVQESSGVIGGPKHDSVAFVSCSAISPSEKKTAEIRSSAVVENVAPLVDTIEIGGKAQSTSISSGENASTKADRSFTFDVSPLVVNAKGEADKSITSTQASQLTELKAGDGLLLTSGSRQTDTKIVQEISLVSPLVTDKAAQSGGAKGERKARRGSSKSSKENPKKGNQVKETNSLKQLDRRDKSGALFSPSVAAQKLQIEAGNNERNITKSNGVVSFPTSSLPDLNTSSTASVLFHQPFTDLQQVQLRAQIFVYGSLIQGAAPDEACMISAFGASGSADGGRGLWDPAWRACVDRIRGQRSHTGNNETPSHPRSEMRNAGPRTPDQANKQVMHQNKVTTPAAGRASGKAINSHVVSPIIPLSSPLWNIPTPSCDGLPSSGMARGAVIDYKALSPMHPYQTPPVRNFVGHTASWLPQAPFPGSWVASPQTSAFPALPVTEPVKLTPVKESSLSISAGTKHATPVSVAHAGESGILAGASPHDDKKASVLPADQKSRKRKKASGTEDRAHKSLRGTFSESVPAPAASTQLSSKAPASDNFGQSSSVAVAPLVAQSQTGPASAPILGHFSTSVVIAPPSSSARINNSDIPIISTPSSTDLSKRELLGKKALTSEYLGKVEESKVQAEEAAASAASAVSHCQDVWSQLDKQKNTVLVADVEAKLTSAAAAVAAAASVAKAAAAAAKIASNAAMQAKLMADEALIACGVSNPDQTNAVSFPNMNNLESATPASILKGREVSNSSSSIIFAAREAARRKIDAASAASKNAENWDAIVKAAELAAEAVSHAGKIVAMVDPLPLNQLVAAGPDNYWKVSQAPSGHGGKAKKVNGDESGISVVQKIPGIFSKRSEGPSDEDTIPACEPTGVSGNMAEDNVRNEEVIQTPVTGVEKDVRGAKGHSMPEMSKAAGLDPESLNDFRLASDDVQACGDAASSKMQEGSLVEVFKDSDDGKRAWYSAKVLTLKNGKALVCYTDHQSDEGLEQLKDWVPLDADCDETPRIRPAHPVTALQGAKKRRRAAVKEYTWYVGDRVDAWIDYRWREGVIAEKNKRDETTFSVNFPAYGDTAVVRAWHLRPTLVWKDGEWVEWSRSRHDFLSQGDTPKEKRIKLGNPASEDTGNDSLSEKMVPLVPMTNEPATLLPLSVNEKTFNIGSNKNDNKPNTLRTMRSGLQKEGSKVFGVPKPGKKRKFMEVSKHYVSDSATKSDAAHGSAKFTKYLMPRATGAGGWKNSSRIDPKEKQVTETRQKPPKPNKLPSSNRNLKDYSITSAGDASGAVGDAVKYNKSEAQQPNVVSSVANAEGRAEGPMKISSEALPANIAKKASASSYRGEGMKKKIPVSSMKSSNVEVKDKLIHEVNEPRRSNRRIQPTSRLLEGLQSSLIISKLPSISHDKGNRSHSRGASR